MLLKDRFGLVLGVANKRSLAWQVARAADAAGARLVLTCQNERMQPNLEKLAPELQQEPIIVRCDVQSDDEIEALFERIGQEGTPLDFMVHALAFAPREELSGAFADTSRAGFQTALDISAYSLVPLAKRAATAMEGRKGSIITMSYLGAERVVQNYNVMGVAKAALESSVRYLAADLGPAGHRVNAISAGPIKTLAASGVSGFGGMLDAVAQKTPLRRNIEGADVGDASLFFLSDLSRAVTGETLYVDCGYHIMGL